MDKNAHSINQSWMNSNGGYNGYYMVAVWNGFTDTQQNDIIGSDT